MIISNFGFNIDQFYIPPFKLHEGELLNLYIYSGGHFFDLEQKLVSIFSGKLKNERVTIREPLEFVENFYDFNYGNLIFPVTVEKFLNQTANLENFKKINLTQDLNLQNKTKLIKTSPYERRLLSLTSTLTRSNNLIFDLVGLDPINAISILKKVKKVVENGGSAILINNFDDQIEKDYCDKHVAIEQIKRK